MPAMHQSTGMFPRKFGYVDELLILEDGVAKEISGGAGINVLAYFSADAVGSVTVTLDNGLVIEATAPNGGGKVITTRNEYECYDATTATLAAGGLSAGTAQVSLF